MSRKRNTRLDERTCGPDGKAAGAPLDSTYPRLPIGCLRASNSDLSMEPASLSVGPRASPAAFSSAQCCHNILPATYLIASPDQYSANRRENESNNQQCRKHRLWSQNWLPCLQTLLLEGSVCKRGEIKHRSQYAKETGAVGDTHWRAASSLASSPLPASTHLPLPCSRLGSG